MEFRLAAPWCRRRGRFAASVVVSLCLATSVAGAQTVDDLRDLSLEELTAIEVTSVSKRREPLSAAPASVYVITNEAIRRSGATRLPEALRLAPNLQVQQIDARSYAISARGFNGYETANKLLVLIDGRTVYTPLHSGVFWDLHEPLLDDIDRIEVVSGPGGTLWGPNAVNGVVNIITRNASATSGLLVRGTVGTTERTASMRYGGQIGGYAAFRLYATGFDRGHSVTPEGNDAEDSWDGFQTGFRADFGGGRDSFTIQGDLFRNDLEDVQGIDGGGKGHNLLLRWHRQASDGSSLWLQAYYDKFEREFLLVEDALETFDLQLQHNWSPGARHQLVWGAGVRTTKDRFINNLNAFVLDPERRRLWVGNLFVQDKISLRDDLALTLGIKFEQTSFTGVEFLPNARLAWQVDDRTLLWSAVSRAVRTPSRIDRQLVNPPLLAPGDDFDSEKLIAFEAGYRGQPTDALSLSLSLFYNIYDDLRTTELRPSGTLPIRLENGLKGKSYGIEAWGDYQVAPWWRLSAGVTVLEKDFTFKRGHVDLTGGASLGNDPDIQFQLRSQLNPADDVEFDIGLRLVDDLPDPAVPSYTALDARLGWRVAPGVELSVAGFNLLDEHHPEAGELPSRREARRSVHAGVRLSF